MTYFTINDPDLPIQIKDKKRSNCNFCVGANLDSDDEKLVAQEEQRVKKEQQDLKKHVHFSDGDQLDISQAIKEHGVLKRALFWICGIESQLKEEAVEQVHVDTSIDQNPKWARVCNVNAVIAIALSGFFVAFFNKYED